MRSTGSSPEARAGLDEVCSNTGQVAIRGRLVTEVSEQRELLLGACCLRNNVSRAHWPTNSPSGMERTPKPKHNFSLKMLHDVSGQQSAVGDSYSAG